MSPDLARLRAAIREMRPYLRADVKMMVRGLHVYGPLPASELVSRMISASSEKEGLGVIELASKMGLIEKTGMILPSPPRASTSALPWG